MSCCSSPKGRWEELVSISVIKCLVALLQRGGRRKLVSFSVMWCPVALLTRGVGRKLVSFSIPLLFPHCALGGGLCHLVSYLVSCCSSPKGGARVRFSSLRVLLLSSRPRHLLPYKRIKVAGRPHGRHTVSRYSTQYTPQKDTKRH